MKDGTIILWWEELEAKLRLIPEEAVQCFASYWFPARSREMTKHAIIEQLVDIWMQSGFHMNQVFKEWLDDNNAGCLDDKVCPRPDYKDCVMYLACEAERNDVQHKEKEMVDKMKSLPVNFDGEKVDFLIEQVSLDEGHGDWMKVSLSISAHLPAKEALELVVKLREYYPEINEVLT